MGDEFNEDHPGKAIIETAAKYGSAVGAFGIGLGMDDFKSAIGFGMVGSAASDKITGAIQEYNDNVQVEENEDAYQDLYDEYVEEYREKFRQEHNGADVSDDTILEQLITTMEQFEQRTISIDKMSDLDRKFFTKGYEKMYDTYDYTGSEKPEEMVKQLTRKAAWENSKKRNP